MLVSSLLQFDAMSDITLQHDFNRVVNLFKENLFQVRANMVDERLQT
jgi:hypothetical protein